MANVLKGVKIRNQPEYLFDEPFWSKWTKVEVELQRSGTSPDPLRAGQSCRGT
jgi:hypothetical protein